MTDEDYGCLTEQDKRAVIEDQSKALTLIRDMLYTLKGGVIAHSAVSELIKRASELGVKIP